MAATTAQLLNTVPSNCAEFQEQPTTTPKVSTAVQALESNASQSLVRDNSIDREYVQDAAPVARRVKPISRTALSNPGTTMQQLHQMTMHELGVLDALNNEGRQIIKTRLMAIWDEMSVRFERGESVNGISGTGGKGMGKYLRSIGIKPAKRRSWKFEVRQRELLRLAQENPPIRAKRKAKTEAIINTETEADLIAKAGIKIAHLLAGDNMMSPQERITRAEAMAKDILEAVADGQYARLEPFPFSTEAPVPDSTTLQDNETKPKCDRRQNRDRIESFSEIREVALAALNRGFREIKATTRADIYASAKHWATAVLETYEG